MKCLRIVNANIKIVYLNNTTVSNKTGVEIIQPLIANSS